MPKRAPKRVSRRKRIGRYPKKRRVNNEIYSTDPPQATDATPETDPSQDRRLFEVPVQLIKALPCSVLRPAKEKTVDLSSDIEMTVKDEVDLGEEYLPEEQEEEQDIVELEDSPPCTVSTQQLQASNIHQTNKTAGKPRNAIVEVTFMDDDMTVTLPVKSPAASEFTQQHTNFEQPSSPGCLPEDSLSDRNTAMPSDGSTQKLHNFKHLEMTGGNVFTPLLTYGADSEQYKFHSMSAAPSAAQTLLEDQAKEKILSQLTTFINPGNSWIVLFDNGGVHALRLSKDKCKAVQRKVFVSFEGPCELLVHDEEVSQECELWKCIGSAPPLSRSTIDAFCDSVLNTVREVRYREICCGIRLEECSYLMDDEGDFVIEKRNKFAEIRYVTPVARSPKCHKLVQPRLKRCVECNKFFKRLGRKSNYLKNFGKEMECGVVDDISCENSCNTAEVEKETVISDDGNSKTFEASNAINETTFQDLKVINTVEKRKKKSNQKKKQYNDINTISASCMDKRKSVQPQNNKPEPSDDVGGLWDSLL